MFEPHRFIEKNVSEINIFFPSTLGEYLFDIYRAQNRKNDIAVGVKIINTNRTMIIFKGKHPHKI